MKKYIIICVAITGCCFFSGCGTLVTHINWSSLGGGEIAAKKMGPYAGTRCDVIFTHDVCKRKNSGFYDWVFKCYRRI